MRRPFLTVLAPLLLVACSSPGDAVPPAAASCIAGGEFHAELYGAVRASLAWRDTGLHCEGMRRPHDAGARLRFAGEVPVADRMQKLAFIVALPELEPGSVGRELRATVTLIEEDNGRFFSNADQDTCWADVESQEALQTDDDSYAINGIVYCVAPLAALRSNASVVLRDLRFAGRVDWRGATP
ncbi:MAG: hypothetical protein WBN23_07855 [Woeseia sp.]